MSNADLIARLRELHGYSRPLELEAANALESLVKDQDMVWQERCVAVEANVKLLAERTALQKRMGELQGHLLEREKELRCADGELKSAWAERDALRTERDNWFRSYGLMEAERDALQAKLASLEK